MEFTLIARQVLPPANQVALWKVTRAWLSPTTDVAFIRLAPASVPASKHQRFRVPPINPLPPQVGDRVAGFGYHSSRIAVDLDGTTMRARWDDEPATSVGEVVEVHEVRRDSVRLSFPCYRTNSRFEGGMSGGPVINDEGEVCGIVCSSVVGDPIEGYTSYVTTLWPSLATFIHFDLDGRDSQVPQRVLSLAKAGILNIRKLDRLDIVEGRSDSTTVCRR